MNNFFRTAVLVVFSFHLATAQDIRIGAKGSLNLTNIPNFTVIEALGQDLKYMATGGAALFAEIPLDQNFTFRPEVAYNRRGGKLDKLNLGSGTIGTIHRRAHQCPFEH
ncbi:MAG: PorT family protein [Leadbetterella sp.]|nr:PorT family protein [Leadbetterella sp.]